VKRRAPARAVVAKLRDPANRATRPNRAAPSVTSVTAVQRNVADTHAPHGLDSAARHAMSHSGASVPFASQPALRALRLWGIVVGLLQPATPLAFWWLDSATV
jgi:hypothetical protein